jgi:hypothetical protein
VHPNNIAMRKNTYLAEVKARVKAMRKLLEQEIERIISLLKEGKPVLFIIGTMHIHLSYSDSSYAG